ncbi:MAG: ferritin-like domain-containing protein [Deltaproteobacteria bacterium]|nr:ferritin-like domain-containing protein [Deltaproteobacteria bacterium]
MLPYGMFDISRSADEARRAEKLASIYHKGQQQAWEGRHVLKELIEKHGGLHLDPAHRGPIRRIFSVLMWGELAAWKISAQLADALVPLEAKMAATSQVFDEARHFYVLHDYLQALNNVPAKPDKHTETALNLVLETPNLVQKLLGMQMLFEPTALTIFKIVRELNVEPVLSDLLTYFEKDEARHVGLGIQALPELINEQGLRDATSTILFQLRVVGHVLRALRVLEDDFQTLGMSSRDVLERGILKFQLSNDVLLSQLDLDLRPVQEVAKRSIVAVCELMFPREGSSGTVDRLFAAARTLRHGADFKVDAAAA